MEIRKSLTAVGAALMMVGVSAPALAADTMFQCGTDTSNPYDKGVISAGLIEMAKSLRCKDPKFSSELNPGDWELPAIWERRREPSCEIHTKLARGLYEKRDFIANPIKPRKNKNDTNLAAGAAYDVQFAQYDEALAKLDAFIYEANKAQLNRLFLQAADYRSVLVRDAKLARDCVYRLSIQ
jgi:hypothetical protein